MFISDDFDSELSLFQAALFPDSSCTLAASRVDKIQQGEAATLWLAPEEQEVHRRFPAGKRSSEWLAGRLAAKAAVARLLTLPLPEFRRKIKVLAQDDGKPVIRFPGSSSRPVELSISHSGSVAAALAAFFPCGLDVQQLSAAAVRVRDRFSSPEEYDILARLLPVSEMECLTLLWAAKEALRKMVPCQPLAGFRELRLIAGSPAGRQQALLRFALERAPAASIFKVAAFLRPGYAWALTIHKQAYLRHL
jgi:4'-phosphopantetheinyl transferase